MTSPPCVVLVTVDTVRADVAYGGAFPTFEELARTGCRFDRAIASAPVTPVSHASVFTGLQPYRHGVRHLLRERLAGGVATLPEALRSRGYRTGAVVAAPALDRWYGFDRGFDVYDDEVPPTLTAAFAEPGSARQRGKAIKRADAVTERALAMARDAGAGPWLLFVHFFDAHWPYASPDTYGVATANDYEAEVAYLQHHLGRLLDGLTAAAGGPERLVAAVLADHGEDLAGRYPDDHTGGGRHPEERGHGCLLFDVTVRVPLWLSAPGRLPGARAVPAQVRLVDVAPTLLDLALGGDAAGLLAGVDGRSLLPLVAGDETADRVAYSESYFREEVQQEGAALRPLLALRPDRRHTVVWEPGGQACWYDGAQDPYQRAPLPAASMPPAVRAHVDAHRSRHGC